MDEVANETETVPIATTTRVPPRGFEVDDESDEETEYPPTLTATRVS